MRDTDGPRVRLGIAWAVVIGASLAGGIYALTAVLALAAGLAARQVADAWSVRGVEPDPWVAFGGAAALVVGGAFDSRWVGAAMLCVVFAALAAAQLNVRRHASLFADAGHSVLAAGAVGLAGASVVSCLRYDELGAAAVLLTFAMVYDAGDFLVGTGASHPLEGPIAGWMAIAAATAVVVVLRVPPFHGADAWLFAALAAAACPLGQLAASAILPSARTRAPALRRLDSLLLLAPAYAFAVGLFLQQHR